MSQSDSIKIHFAQNTHRNTHVTTQTDKSMKTQTDRDAQDVPCQRVILQ